MRKLPGLLVLIIIIAAVFLLFLKLALDITLNDIFPPKEISLKEIGRAIGPPSGPKKSTIQDTTPVDSLKTDSDDKVQFDYYIIVESFKNLTLAQQRAEKLINDFNKNIIVLPSTADGFYRISYGKYSTYEEAESAIKSIRTSIRSDAWIYSLKK
jgi:hypothetical protein